MPNHVHLVSTPHEPKAIDLAIDPCLRQGHDMIAGTREIEKPMSIFKILVQVVSPKRRFGLEGMSVSLASSALLVLWLGSTLLAEKPTFLETGPFGDEKSKSMGLVWDSRGSACLGVQVHSGVVLTSYQCLAARWKDKNTKVNWLPNKNKSGYLRRENWIEAIHIGTDSGMSPWAIYITDDIGAEEFFDLGDFVEDSGRFTLGGYTSAFKGGKRVAWQTECDLSKVGGDTYNTHCRGMYDRKGVVVVEQARNMIVGIAEVVSTEKMVKSEGVMQLKITPISSFATEIAEMQRKLAPMLEANRKAKIEAEAEFEQWRHRHPRKSGWESASELAGAVTAGLNQRTTPASSSPRAGAPSGRPQAPGTGGSKVNAGCQPTLGYLASKIPTVPDAKLMEIRRDILSQDMSGVIARIRAQGLTLGQAAQQMLQQANADDAAMGPAEVCVRQSTENPESILRALQSRSYSGLHFGGDVLGACIGTYIAADWARMANREAAVQVACNSVPGR